jgi:hypothetical protein
LLTPKTKTRRRNKPPSRLDAANRCFRESILENAPRSRENCTGARAATADL